MPASLDRTADCPCGRADRTMRPASTNRGETSMPSVRLSVLVALLGVLAACSTAPLRQAEGIAVSGKAYAQAVRGVGDLALTESLDYTVDQVAFERDRATDREKRKANLERTNTMLKRRIELVETANLQIALVEEYFVALEALAKYDPTAPTTAAFGSLLASLNSVEQSINTSAGTAEGRLTQGEINAAAKLAGQVARSAHAQQVSARLAEDAPIIGRHLRMLSKELVVLSEWVSARQEDRFTTFYAVEIEAPFADPGRPLPADWKEKYKRYLRGTAVNERVKQAGEAGKAMERTWERYLAGEQSPEEVLQSVQDMQQLVQAVAALKAARAAAAAGSQ